MTEAEKKSVQDTVEQEGFLYAFQSYSSFDEVTDKEFHKKRDAFLAAAQDLANYIGMKD